MYGKRQNPEKFIPNTINKILKNEEILIRNSEAVRPWQHVLEPISGIFTLIEKMWNDPKNFSQAWNFGPSLKNNNIPVRDVVKEIISQWGNGKWADRSKGSNMHEANMLKLDSTKALKVLKWKTVFSFKKSIQETISWYKNYADRNNKMKDFSIGQIENYVNNARKKDILWAKS